MNANNIYFKIPDLRKKINTHDNLINSVIIPSPNSSKNVKGIEKKESNHKMTYNPQQIYPLNNKALNKNDNENKPQMINNINSNNYAVNNNSPLTNPSHPQNGIIPNKMGYSPAPFLSNGTNNAYQNPNSNPQMQPHPYQGGSTQISPIGFGSNPPIINPQNPQPYQTYQPMTTAYQQNVMPNLYQPNQNGYYQNPMGYPQNQINSSPNYAYQNPNYR